MTTCILHLPWPPSVNAIWRRGRGNTHKSAKYQAWLKEAGWELQRQRPPKIAGEYTISIRLSPPDLRRRDQDNFIKVVNDLLVSHGVVEDDSLATETVIRWDLQDVKPGVRVSLFCDDGKDSLRSESFAPYEAVP